MNYITNEYKHTLEIQKSIFITYIMPLNSVEDVKDILLRLKKEYPKASHYCYAYIYDQIKHSSDDGEPSGTAGRPMLNVLSMQNVNRIIAITIRFFGGIKLGAGGLIRAYVQSVKETLDMAIFFHKVILKKIKLSFPYKYIDKALYYLEKEKYLILKKEFLDEVEVIVAREIIDENRLKELFLGELTIDMLGKEEIFVPIED